ncbi:MAG: bifunctional phosphopantothenoylcysteine decarboxylase/phosphopantothenate--cysteine ligase CoaBC [Melioribacteraceae bacterium]
MLKSKILVEISGSVAAYKSAYLISKLVQNGFEVKVVATENALRFIGKATLEGLTGNQVYTDPFAPNQVMSHIDLVKWADLTIVCPATANTINKMANGIADNLLTSLFMAHDWSKPYLLAPAMNTLMYNHPATQESLVKLSNWGVEVLPVAEGNLACGDIGRGKLLEPDEIYQKIMEVLEKRNQTGKRQKIMITSGGTRENIDGVRFISNLSTGKTGAALAEYFSRCNYEVTLIHAHDSIQPMVNCKKIKFSSFDDLNEILKNLLSTNSYDAVIHLAAVSDFFPVSLEINKQIFELPMQKKLDSDAESLTISFRKNFKIVEMLKSYSANNKLMVIAFKLTSGADIREKIGAIKKMFANSKVDFIVSNDSSDRIGNQVQTNFKIYNRELKPIDCATFNELSKELEKIIAGTK